MKEQEQKEQRLQELAHMAGRRVQYIVCGEPDGIDRMILKDWHGIERNEPLRVISKEMEAEREEAPRRDLKILQVSKKRGLRAHYRLQTYFYSPLRVMEDGSIKDIGRYDEGTITFEYGITDSPFHIDPTNLHNYPLRKLLGESGLGFVHDELTKIGEPYTQIQVDVDKGEITNIIIFSQTHDMLYRQQKGDER